MHKIVSISSSVSAHHILAYNEVEDVKHVFVTSNSVMAELWKMPCIQLPKVSVFTWNARKFPLNAQECKLLLLWKTRQSVNEAFHSTENISFAFISMFQSKLQLKKNVRPLLFLMFWLISYLNTVSFQFLNHTWSCFAVKYMFDTPTY